MNHGNAWNKWIGGNAFGNVFAALSATSSPQTVDVVMPNSNGTLAIANAGSGLLQVQIPGLHNSASTGDFATIPSGQTGYFAVPKQTFTLTYKSDATATGYAYACTYR